MDPFTLLGPREPQSPVVAHLPHCGTFVPPGLQTAFRPEMRSLPDTDWHVDELFGFLPELGVTVLRANYSRYVIDLNRELVEPLFGPIVTSAVPSESFEGWPIYRHPPSKDEIERRAEQIYRPCHAELQRLLDERVERFGRAYLLDLHSFDDAPPADFCLGDDEGRLQSATTMASLRDNLGAAFRVAENEIWTGGYITIHYGSQSGVEAVQIETNHALYLGEGELREAKSPALGRVKPPGLGERFESARERLQEPVRRVVRELSRSASNAPSDAR